MGGDEVRQQHGGHAGQVRLQISEVVGPYEDKHRQQGEEDWRPTGQMGANDQENVGTSLVADYQTEEEEEGQADWGGQSQLQLGNDGYDDCDVSEGAVDGDDDHEDEYESQPEPAL